MSSEKETLDIDTLKAGPELDALVAEQVMGLTWDESRCRVCGWPLKEKLEDGCVPENCSLRPGPIRRADSSPRYSTDLLEAWKVVEKEHLCIHPASCNPPFYWVGYPGGLKGGMVGDIENRTLGTGETAPLAICRSALKIAMLAREDR